VFLNLLTNAADAIPEGAPGAHEVRIATRTDGDGRAVVEIADTGCGLSAEVARRAFEPFFTTKPAGTGTGLGLAVCRQILTELGGTIDFESAPGATTFRVTLPAQTGSEPRQLNGAAHAAPAPRRRILVVDDEPAILVTLRIALADRHDVVTAGGVREAVAILDGGGRFDAIIADLMMADATGIELYECVRQRDPDLARRFVFMTGGAFAPKARKFLAETPNRVLEKPFESAELVEAVAAAMEGARVGSSMEAAHPVVAHASTARR
jgi:CheY-like chemotaxis protein